MTDKARLVQSIITALEAELTLITQAAQSAREEAIDEESRPENQYDMHSQEAAYLAEGQARLAAEIRDHLDHYRALDPAALVVRQPIALGALITLSPATGPSRRYFLGPRAGGLEVPDGDGSVLLITPASPLGRQLLGKKVGDQIELPGKSSATRLRIARVE
jgi:transcription elongation GreA/GreB family factor